MREKNEREILLQRLMWCEQARSPAQDMYREAIPLSTRSHRAVGRRTSSIANRSPPNCETLLSKVRQTECM
jgi:hypothetical protein